MCYCGGCFEWKKEKEVEKKKSCNWVYAYIFFGSNPVALFSLSRTARWQAYQGQVSLLFYTLHFSQRLNLYLTF